MKKVKNKIKDNKKTIVIASIIGVLLFMFCYYSEKDNKVNNFINHSPIKIMSDKDMIKIGDDLLKKAISFYEEVPSNYNNKVIIDDKEYYELKNFSDEASTIFSNSEINDFISYYNIKEKNNKYYINTKNNKLTYIYDDIDLKVKNDRKNEIYFKVKWSYCLAENSNNLNECTDTTTIIYTNNMTTKKINGKWIITDFSFPNNN